MNFNDAIDSMPLIVSLRGIHINEVSEVGKILIEAGIKVLEVTIRTKNAATSSLDNDALRTLEKLIEIHGENVHVAAGTVMQIDDLNILKEAGVTVCLSPSLNPDVVKEAALRDISFVPGVETCSEVMTAIRSGAKGLKMFPSFYYEPNGDVTLRLSPGYVRYLSKFVSCPIFVSGDLRPDDLPLAYFEAGATGFNIGSNLYQPNIDLKDLAERAKCFVAAMKRRKL